MWPPPTQAGGECFAPCRKITRNASWWIQAALEGRSRAFLKPARRLETTLWAENPDFQVSSKIAFLKWQILPNNPAPTWELPRGNPASLWADLVNFNFDQLFCFFRIVLTHEIVDCRRNSGTRSCRIYQLNFLVCHGTGLRSKFGLGSMKLSLIHI